MSVFEYYFYPPNRPQFFFPKKEFKIYQKFYKPFSTKSIVFWFFFKNSFLIRSFFKINERNIPLPILTIKKIIGLKGYGLEVIERVPIEIPPNEVNEKYLETKKNILGTVIDSFKNFIIKTFLTFFYDQEITPIYNYYLYMYKP